MKRKIIENYSLYQVIGEGMYGKVYRALNTITSHEYAIKVIPVTKFQENPKLEECTANEIKILSKLEPSPYLIKYIELHRTKNNFYFVYEYCNGKTLEHRLKNQGNFQEKEALRLFELLLEAFKVLNKYNIMHRDLKPDNIFFHNGDIKLGDFGFCKSFIKSNDMTSTMLGSPIYMAPEVLKGEVYSSKADIWSLGVVLFEMLFGTCPFESSSIAKLISVLAENDLVIPLEVNNISVSTQNLLKKLLVKDQFKRIEWFQLLNYNFSDDPQRNDRDIANLMDATCCFTPMSSEYSDNDHRAESPKYNKDTNDSNPESPFKRKADEWTKTSPMRFYAPGQSVSRLHKIKSVEIPSTPTSMSREPNSATILKKKSAKDTIPMKELAPSKRKGLLQIHNTCLGAVRTAINLVKSLDSNGLLFSFVIFKKVEAQLNSLCDSISYSDLELQDMVLTINAEIRQVERQSNEVEKELKRQGTQTGLSCAKEVLRQRISNREDINSRLWYEMVCFLGDERVNLRASVKEYEKAILSFLE